MSTTPGEQLDFAAAPAASSAASSESADSAASSETEAETDQRLESLNTLMSALDSYGMLGDATRMEFADTEEMAFLYQDRISVLLGTLNELDYKLKLAQYVLLNQDGKGCAATDTGLLDLSHLSASSTRKFRFAQGEPTLPSGYLVPEVSTPEETPVENPDAAEADPPADAELSAETSAAPEAARGRSGNSADRKKQQTGNHQSGMRSVLLMKLEQLMEDVPFTLVQGTLETEIEDIIYDSRKAAPGLLFVCIVGTQRDSHDLAADCVAKGVNTLVIQHDIDLSAMPDVNVIKVESSRYAMAK